MESPGPRRARRRLVQGFRNVQDLWHGPASEHVSPGRPSRAGQAIVKVGGLSWAVGEVRKPQTHLLCAGFRSLSFKMPQKERRPRKGGGKKNPPAGGYKPPPSHLSS